jgi:hypothetical protein
MNIDGARSGPVANAAWTAQAGMVRTVRPLGGHCTRRAGGGVVVAGDSDGEARRGPAEEH